jgi:hypothetical protein
MWSLRWVHFTILLVGFSLFYARFRSPDLMAVDGAFRSCEVYHRQDVFFHANNHLLYPVNVRAWDRLVRPALGTCGDPLEFARRTQLMNGLASALSVAIFFLLLRGATGSPGIAFWAACAYGFSYGLLVHATNAAEPLVGLLWSFVAVATAALSRKGDGRHSWLAALAGLFLATAMAAYQSMVLVGPAVFLLCAAPTKGTGLSRQSIRRGQVVRVLALLAGGTTSVVAIYRWAYAHQGIKGVKAQLHEFLEVAGGDVYRGFSASKVINTPIGLVGNFFHAYPADYSGLRLFFRLHAGDGWAAWLVLLVFASALVAVTLAAMIWRYRSNLVPCQRLGLWVAAVAAVCTLFAPIYWAPTYDKLWLQPIAVLIALAALVLAALPLTPGRHAVMMGCMAAITLEVLISGLWVVANSGRETPYLQEARQVDAILQPDDLLIYEWHGVSVLYVALYGFGRPQVCFPTAAHRRGVALIDDIRELSRQAQDRGARVYFLGVMDHTEASWESFIGRRLHIPYHARDGFRERCHPMAAFPLKTRNVTLRILEVTSDQTGLSYRSGLSSVRARTTLIRRASAGIMAESLVCAPGWYEDRPPLK